MEQVNRDEFERAARRIMEMNSKAQSALSRKRETHEKSDEVGKHSVAAATAPIKKEPVSVAKNSIFDIINFKNMAGDRDRTLLAGLMLLLGGEMADEKLMLALLYIML